MMDQVTCSRKDCDHPGEFNIRINMYAKGHARSAKNMSTAHMPLVVCGGCAAKLTIADVLGDEGKQQIADAFTKQKLAPPDFTSVELVLIPRSAKPIEGKGGRGAGPRRFAN